jgi:hypothetical protein
MAFPVARVGSLTAKGDKIVTGASSMFTDPATGSPSISYSINGQVVIYDERDLGSEDDDPESDDGLAVYPPVYGRSPTAMERARSNSLTGSAGSPLATDDLVTNNTGPLPADCANIRGTVPYSLQLSPNFKLSDVTVGTAISRQGVVAQHGLTVAQIVCNLKGMCTNYLEPLAARYGRRNMIITSGFRAGSSKSQHERGMAADVQFLNISDDEYWVRAKWIKDNVCYDQFILEYLGNRPWLHGSFNRTGNRKQVLTAVTNGNYVSGLKKMR